MIMYLNFSNLNRENLSKLRPNQTCKAARWSGRKTRYGKA